VKERLKKVSKNRLQKRTQRTRKKLKKAALDIFSGKSIDAATVEEITEKADVGKGMLYQHFANKEEIAVTLLEDAVDHLAAHIRCYEDRPESLEEMLEHLLAAHYDFCLSSKEEFLLLFQGRALLKLKSETMDEIEEPYLRYLEEIEEQVSRYLSPGIDHSKVRRLACAIAGFVFGFFSFAMIGLTSEQIEASIKPLRRTFVRSLCTFLGR